MRKNIYILGTDGGAIQQPDKTFNSVASFVMYQQDKELYKESVILKGKTNNYAEMYAIFKGLKSFYNYLYGNGIKDSSIVILTDSELCKKILTEWFDNWLDNANDEKLYNSTKKLVANQELIKSTMLHLMRLQKIAKINICHINSHESVANIEKNRRKFNKVNGTKINIDDYALLFKINKQCDDMIKESFRRENM